MNNKLRVTSVGLIFKIRVAKLDIKRLKYAQ